MGHTRQLPALEVDAQHFDQAIILSAKKAVDLTSLSQEGWERIHTQQARQTRRGPHPESELAAQHQDSLPTPPWVWVHVPDCRACAAHADMCGDFYIDARVLFVDSPAKLGVGGKVSLKAARRFLKKLGGSELRQLANRLQVLNED